MRKALGVNPRSPLLMFLAVRSGKSCKKRPLRISGFPACSLGLRVLLVEIISTFPSLLVISLARSYRSGMIGRPLTYRIHPRSPSMNTSVPNSAQRC